MWLLLGLFWKEITALSSLQHFSLLLYRCLTNRIKKLIMILPLLELFVPCGCFWNYFGRRLPLYLPSNISPFLLLYSCYPTNRSIEADNEPICLDCLHCLAANRSVCFFLFSRLPSPLPCSLRASNRYMLASFHRAEVCQARCSH